LKKITSVRRYGVEMHEHHLVPRGLLYYFHAVYTLRDLT